MVLYRRSLLHSCHNHHLQFPLSYHHKHAEQVYFSSSAIVPFFNKQKTRLKKTFCCIFVLDAWRPSRIRGSHDLHVATEASSNCIYLSFSSFSLYGCVVALRGASQQRASRGDSNTIQRHFSQLVLGLFPASADSVSSTVP